MKKDKAQSLLKKLKSRKRFMQKFRNSLLVIAMFISWNVFGQGSIDSLLVLPDSIQPLTIESFYHYVTTNHPVARQAGLLSDVARQELRLARGNFDPKLEAQYLTKSYNGTTYYNIFNSSLKLPTILPFDPAIGVEQNSGTYLNPEHYISNQFDYRQFYAGISLPLGRGLITDERRAALKQAELFGDMMVAEQVKIMNKLFLDAAKDYWNWAFAFYNYKLFDRNVGIASEIFRRVKLNHRMGEAAPIDTVQAKITLQQRIVERQEAFLEFQNTGIRLSNYLWDSLSNPLELSLNFAPILQRDLLGMTEPQRDELVNLARTNHPELQKIEIKLRQLDVDRRLAKEFLKPRLDLNYYLINQPFDPDWNANLQFTDNYKFGLDFSFPVFLRKERAKLAQTKLKITNTQFEQSFAERQIVNQVLAAYNELTNNERIIAQQSDMVENYNRLLQAELLNLESGESDLFKINIQIEKLIQSQSKLIKLLGDYEKQKAFLYWAAGTRRLR